MTMNTAFSNGSYQQKRHVSRWYSNLICGVIRGCLEQLQLRVECRFEKDALNGVLAEGERVGVSFLDGLMICCVCRGRINNAIIRDLYYI